MTTKDEAVLLRKFTRALDYINLLMDDAREKPGLSDEVRNLIAIESDRLAHISYALDLQAEVMDPTPRRTIKQLDAGKSVPAIHGERT